MERRRAPRLRRARAGAIASLAAALAALGCSSDPDDEFRRAELGIFVLVVDGLRPSEIGAITPNLAALRDGGTEWTESRSVLIAETIPNHVAMMTGVYPRRSGIAANDYWDRTGAPDGTNLSDPEELDAKTLFTVLDEQCPAVRTTGVLSKRYLFEIFSAGGINVAPDGFWDPRPTNLPEPDGHSPDLVTMEEALARLPKSDFMFVNLGDVDRSGHVDETGTLGLSAFRTAVLAATDAQVGRFLDALRASGRWERSIVFVVSDHGFDWSLPPSFVSLDAVLPGNLFPVQNGGAETIFLVDRDHPDRDDQLARARTAALAEPGVDVAWYRAPNPLDPDPESVVPDELGLDHENAGDLIVLAKRGWRFSDPLPVSNPIPGNHGHLVTRHNTFLIGGGAPFLRHGQRIAPSRPSPSPLDALPEQSENVDVAPTVAWLFGLEPRGYDGRVLAEAFTVTEPPSTCGAFFTAE
jgi:hypothetical protein